MAEGEGDRHTTPRRVISVEDGPWARFGALVGVRNRSGVIRQFIGWYNGEPGAKLPRRPKASEPADAAEPDPQ
jgi:hypothetical protein